MLTELTFAILKYGFLVLLWIFVACTVRSLYRDIETLSPRKSRAHRRKERAARKEQEKLRKIEERQLKARCKAREAGAGASATQELKLFGLHVPLPTTRQQEPQTRNKEDGTHE